MRVRCPMCGGKGSIPDPKYEGVPMEYVGPHGERCPEKTCPACFGTGVQEE